MDIIITVFYKTHFGDCIAELNIVVDGEGLTTYNLSPTYDPWIYFEIPILYGGSSKISHIKIQNINFFFLH